jgi:amino acid transporter
VAYPSGGGAYIVARENLGTYPGLVAAAALLTDYLLTVAVSVAPACASSPPCRPAVPAALAVGFVVFITLANRPGTCSSAPHP